MIDMTFFQHDKIHIHMSRLSLTTKNSIFQFEILYKFCDDNWFGIHIKYSHISPPKTYNKSYFNKMTKKHIQQQQQSFQYFPLS